MIVDYPVRHDETIYDICDLDGRICMSGKLKEGINNEIDMSSLSSGKYQLFIIDEGNIHSKLVNLN